MSTYGIDATLARVDHVAGMVGAGGWEDRDTVDLILDALRYERPESADDVARILEDGPAEWADSDRRSFVSHEGAAFVYGPTTTSDEVTDAAAAVNPSVAVADGTGVDPYAVPLAIACRILRARYAADVATFVDAWRDALDDVERCPACGDILPDYCAGHGDIGDPRGAAILERHDDGGHGACHPLACHLAGADR